MATHSDFIDSDSSQSKYLPRYTPSPWSFDEDDARIYYDDGNVQPTIAYLERDGVAPEQMKADGYLLAAAPLLLSALIIAKAEIEAWRNGFNTRTGLRNLHKAKTGACFGGLVAANGAVAKAGGAI